MKKKRWIIVICLLLFIGFNHQGKVVADNGYDKLKVPVSIEKCGDFYFIVDTYNNQIIYSKNRWDDLEKWKTLATELNLPHGIDSDGKNYLVLDTDNNRVLNYRYEDSKFKLVQSFPNIGIRPHYIEYVEDEKLFYVWSSMTGEMYLFKQNEFIDQMYLLETRKIDELNSYYVRSFYLEGDDIFFPSGTNGYIIKADRKSFKVLERYYVPDNMAGMACMRRIGAYFYLTVSTDLYGNHNTAKFIRTTDLKTLKDGLYENITGAFKNMEIPYYITNFDGQYFITNHGEEDSIFSFSVDENNYISSQKIK